MMGNNKAFRVFCFFLSVLMILSLFSCGKKEEENKKTKEETQTKTEEVISETKEKETGEEFPKTPLMHGIDVSKWQGNIDFAKLRADGVEFAMVRLGFSEESGVPGTDPNFEVNLKKADENGILTGVYFYSQAKDENAARTEAQFVVDRISPFAISFPVVMDYEWTGEVSALSAKERTDIALAFLDVIKSAGYEPMLYVPISELLDEKLWEKERVFENALVWGASYDAPVYPEKEHPDSSTPYAMWQYSNTGRKAGISGNVDLDLAYFVRERKEAKNPIPPEIPVTTTKPPVTTTKREFNQTFTSCDKMVTAKVEVNLRAIPSIEGELLGTLKKGEYVSCTGESDMGWSRLLWNGQRVFAVTTYLVDESGESTVPQQSFTPVQEEVSAKETVNLRISPSVEAEVVGQLSAGEYLPRTGIGDKGWSRLLYNGVEVYAVTSYLTVK